MADVKRRQFMALLLGGMAAAWPLAARAQQPAMPVIGFLSSLSEKDTPRIMAPFRQGLAEAGYAEGRNVAIEYRFAEGQFARLPAMAADLVRRQVAVIAAVSGTPAGSAAKAATTTIPIVFAMGSDPVGAGLVGSLNRPGGNVTGATFYTVLLGAKRLELLRELVPKATTIALLTNPKNPVSVVQQSDVEAGARTMGLQVRNFDISSIGEIEAAFRTLARERPDALYVTPDVLFFTHRKELAALATRLGLPAIYGDRDNAEAGGLMSYGASRPEAYRLAGVYVGRILKGEKAGDLPVMLATKFELVFNLRTAKALGFEIPPMLLARADEVIE
jgi:putative tryptophan/tyrosine transport system substrate-binding protein